MAKGDDELTNITFILYTITTSLRGFIFAIVYLGAQQIVKKVLLISYVVEYAKRKNYQKLKVFLKK